MRDESGESVRLDLTAFCSRQNRSCRFSLLSDRVDGFAKQL
jgi:hypothetical protein